MSVHDVNVYYGDFHAVRDVDCLRQATRSPH